MMKEEGLKKSGFCGMTQAGGLRILAKVSSIHAFLLPDDLRWGREERKEGGDDFGGLFEGGRRGGGVG
jgi:hypothetical protein